MIYPIPWRTCKACGRSIADTEAAEYDESEQAWYCGCPGSERMESTPPMLGPTFDPAKCDHGAECYGARQWDWCENCQPERAEAAMEQFSKERVA